MLLLVLDWEDEEECTPCYYSESDGHETDGGNKERLDGGEMSCGCDTINDCKLEKHLTNCLIRWPSNPEEA